MRRADRLFQIIQILRRRGLTTAAEIALELEVSDRTVYRDIKDMMASGVPIEGEAGVGYLLSDGYDLPPIMFTLDEIEALALGARMVAAWGDKRLARATEDILTKIETVLPEAKRDILNQTSLYALNFRDTDGEKAHMEILRAAIRDRYKVHLAYVDEKEASSDRIVRPLCLAFLAPRWLLTGWCEWRRDFRSFRLDRIQDMTLLNDQFEDERGKTLKDYLQLMT